MECYDLLLHYALLHLLRVLDDFGGARMPYLCTPHFVHEHWGASPFLFRTLALYHFDCFSSLWRCLKWFHPFCNLLILNMVWFPLISVKRDCKPSLWRNSYYNGSLNFSSHFGNRCQWGRSLEGLREFRFYAFVAFAFKCALHSCLFVMQGCSIRYINPLKRDCHQLPKWGRLKVHGWSHA